MNLIVDIGNTVTKLAVFEQNELVQKFVVGQAEVSQKLEEIIKNFPFVRKMVVSNVSSMSLEISEEIKSRVQVLELSTTTALPFKNLYGTPATLGNDRKALAAAAVQQFPGENVLVIDIGTCITYDFKSANNEYLGGGISPGLKMRFLALNSFTANLPLVEIQEKSPLIGDCTDSSIRSGVINGTRFEIEGMIDKYSQRYKNLITIITGGDATFLSINLKNSIFANSNFLLEGLNFILEFNIDQ